jgi:hypothetical protein
VHVRPARRRPQHDATSPAGFFSTVKSVATGSSNNNNNRPVHGSPPLPRQQSADPDPGTPPAPPPPRRAAARNHRVPLSTPASPRSPSRFTLLKASLSCPRCFPHFHISFFLSFPPFCLMMQQSNYTDDGNGKIWIDSFSSPLIWLIDSCCSSAAQAKADDGKKLNRMCYTPAISATVELPHLSSSRGKHIVLWLRFALPCSLFPARVPISNCFPA